VGRWTTVVGILASMAAAYAAASFNNIMDILQLVFAFVNAPLFATFLLGMFWKRTTGHGAFFGLIAGTVAAAIHHGLSLPHGASAGIKGGWLGAVHVYPSEMAQNFWTAIFAGRPALSRPSSFHFSPARKKTDEELGGLVYSLTSKIKERDARWWQRPALLGSIVLALAVVLNLLFW